ncbi:MAG: hypothetical protein OEY13_02365 [Gammaproteobacteria bacterium]|nr:hypothetical protein [Gammaproteobacteria bacterium]
MTAEDKRAEIDRRFDETFAVFDERMRKEQETISQERAGREGSAGGSGGEGAAGDDTEGGGGANGDGSGGETKEAAGEGSDTGAGASGTGGEGGQGGDVAAGSGTQGGGGGVGGGAKGGGGPREGPADIPDGRDDDIVARQLREAAMKETDPELRERLWEEYRKYKQSTQ